MRGHYNIFQEGGTVQDDVPPVARNIGQSPLLINGLAQVVRSSGAMQGLKIRTSDDSMGRNVVCLGPTHRS